jgi:Ser/Thr protein kinase RdoA (MazF antagonist)
VSEPVVQGLAGEQTAAPWAALSAAELAPVLSEFGRSAAAIGWHSPRPWTAAAIVDTATGPVFVKRHDLRVRDRAGLAVEHGFIRHLRDRDFPTPVALTTAAGDSVVTTDCWAYEVFELAQGDDRYRDRHSWTPYLSVPDARAAGTLLARLHNAAEGYDAPPVARDRPLSNPLRLLRALDLPAAIRAYAAARPALAAFVASRPWERDLDQLAGFHAELVRVLPDQAPLWGHGDWHGSNLTWDDAGAVAAIDFGLADRTCAAFDVATALERAAIGWLNLVHGREPAVAIDQVDALLDGYASERPVDSAAVAAFLPLVHVELALSELDQFTRVVPRPADAELAYRYLVDHPRWFAGPGRPLLAHLTQPTRP